MDNIARSSIMRRIVNTSWYHSFEVLPGIVTPGIYPYNAAPLIDLMQLPKDLRGKRILEIGVCDGSLAFVLEEMGADVVAVDIQDPTHTGFAVAHDIRRSNITYIRASVYELEDEVSGEFDWVIMFGVLYHLRHPLLALEQLHAKLRPEGILILEGEMLLNYAEESGNKNQPLSIAESDALAKSKVPLAACYPGFYKEASNWFVPNRACLEAWFHASGLDILSFDLLHNRRPDQRYVCRLKRRTTCAVEEHPVYERGFAEEHSRVLVEKAHILLELYKADGEVSDFEAANGRILHLLDRPLSEYRYAIPFLEDFFQTLNLFRFPAEEFSQKLALRLASESNRNSDETFFLAQLYLQLEQPKEALACFEEVARDANASRQQEALFHLGKLQYSRGALEQAEESFRQFLEIPWGGGHAPLVESLVTLAEIAKSRKDDSARSYQERARTILESVQEPSLKERLSISILLKNLGALQSARTSFENYLKHPDAGTQPKSMASEAWFNYGEVLYQLGDWKACRHAYDEFHRLREPEQYNDAFRTSCIHLGRIAEQIVD